MAAAVSGTGPALPAIAAAATGHGSVSVRPHASSAARILRRNLRDLAHPGRAAESCDGADGGHDRRSLTVAFGIACHAVLSGDRSRELRFQPDRRPSHPEPGLPAGA